MEQPRVTFEGRLCKALQIHPRARSDVNEGLKCLEKMKQSALVQRSVTRPCTVSLCFVSDPRLEMNFILCKVNFTQLQILPKVQMTFFVA